MGTTHGALLLTSHPSCDQSHPLQAPRAAQNSNPSTSSPGEGRRFCPEKLLLPPPFWAARSTGKGAARPRSSQGNNKAGALPAARRRAHPRASEPRARTAASAGGTRLCSAEIRAKRAGQPPGTAGEAFPNFTEASQRPKTPANGSRSSSEESQAPNPSADPLGTGGNLHRNAARDEREGELWDGQDPR